MRNNTCTFCKDTIQQSTSLSLQVTSPPAPSYHRRDTGVAVVTPRAQSAVEYQDDVAHGVQHEDVVVRWHDVGRRVRAEQLISTTQQQHTNKSTEAALANTLPRPTNRCTGEYVTTMAGRHMTTSTEAAHPPPLTASTSAVMSDDDGDGDMVSVGEYDGVDENDGDGDSDTVTVSDGVSVGVNEDE